jgi:conjugative relaxase-like TrwC/TraI family protein
LLSVANVSAGQASSYYEKDDYYVRDEGGLWQGELKDKFDLPDGITKEDFDRFVNQHEERAGFDLCFSAPKSVSIAFCREENREDVLDAHNRAVAETLKHIEENELYARVTNNRKTEYVKTDNFLCGKFNHFVSRNQDPQIHTHCVVLNNTEVGGKPYAISNENIYRNKMLYGQMYRNALANSLQEKGYQIEVTDKSKGFFELSGISRDQIDMFSTRRAEILETLDKWGNDSSKAASRATLLTRQAKENKDFNLLSKSWNETLDGTGIHINKDPDLIKKTPIKDISEVLANTERKLGQSTFAFEKNEFLKEALKEGLEHRVTMNTAQEYFDSRLGKEIFFLGDRGGRSF